MTTWIARKENLAELDRLTASVAHLRAEGVQVDGAVGDADPLLAIDDAVRTFDPEQIIVATHAEGRSNWLERGLVVQARERWDIPITHVEVLDTTTTVTRTREPVDRQAPAREQHERRDWLWFVLAGGWRSAAPRSARCSCSRAPATPSSSGG